MRRPILFFTASCIALAAAPPSLQDVLRRTAQASETFWADMAAVNCNEFVTQTKLDANGKPAAKQDASFDYLVVAHLAPDDLRFEESRVHVGGNPLKKAPPLLVTSGFSALLLIFHPYFQGSYEYAAPEPAELDGALAFRIAFRQIRGTQSPSCLRLRGRDYPLEWKGTAWLDAQSGAVVKIHAELASAMEDVGLRELKAEVRYAPVHFNGLAQAAWLPAEAWIEAATPRQRWRNTHRFVNYKRFSVETTSRTEAPR